MAEEVTDLRWNTSESGVVASRALDEGVTFSYGAEDIRQEKTGLHAKVSIALDGRELDYDLFNVGRYPDRVRLANACTKQLNGRGDDLLTTYTQLVGADPIKRDLGQFCLGIWAHWSERFTAELLGGDVDTPAQAFVLAPYVLEDASCLIFAPGGRGKSYLALLMAVSVDAGCNTLWPVKQTPVLFVNLERSAQSIRRRLGLVNLALELAPTRPLRFLNARGSSLSNVVDRIAAVVKREGIGLTVLDSISRSGMGDLNDNKAANSIMDTLSAACPTFIGIGHQAWGNAAPDSEVGPHMFGATQFTDATDVAVELRAQRLEDMTLGVGLNMVKYNDVAPAPLRILALEFDQHGLESVREAREGEFPDVVAGKKQTIPEVILAFLEKEDGQTLSEIAHHIGLSNDETSKKLSRMKSQKRLDNTDGAWWLRE